MDKLCLGCMKLKPNIPICEYCGFDERTENQPHQLPIGTILQNQYLVGRVLGQGGFGITYIGWDQHLSIPVAIKEYYPGGVVQRNTRWSTDVMCANGEAPELFEKHKTRFLKEARTLAQLSGIPEIVQIKSFFPENGTAYIVMEYVEGITLKDHLKRLGRPMTEGEALTIMEPVLKALQKVHDHGLIHRDISPDNIMLPSGGGVKLIDFGTVRYMDDSGKSKSTEAVLKPGFAPMEQYNTRGNLGTWTDVYAICATFHYLLTGKVPADVHDRLDDGEELTLLRSRRGISGKLIEAMEMGMKIRAQDRAQTIEELYRLLYGGKKKPAVPKQQEIKKSVPEKKTKKKGKGSLLAACTAAAVAVGVAAMLLIPRNEEPIATQSLPETTNAIPQSVIPETATSAATLSREEAYQEARRLAASGAHGEAAIAFAKLNGYLDSYEQSYHQWSLVPNRRTISLWRYNDIIVFHALKTDGSLAIDVAVKSMIDDTLAQNYTSEHSDLVSIHGIIGLRFDGTIAYPAYLDVFSSWTDIVQLSTNYTSDGALLSCAGLRADGTVVIYNANTPDQINVEDWKDIIAISISDAHVVGLKHDGTVIAAGYHEDGRCDVSEWTNIISISTNGSYTYGLTQSGRLLAAGKQSTHLDNVLAAKKDVAVLLDSDYALGQRGNIMCVPGYWSNVIKPWENIVDVTGFGEYTVALTQDGTLLFASFNDSVFENARQWEELQIPLRAYE